VLRELGLLERFLELPVNRITTMDVVIDGQRFTPVDFSTLRGPEDFLVFAPQWDFLDFLAAEGAKLPGFEVRMSTEATDLIRDGDAVAGLVADGIEYRAPLTVAADGRGSRIRDAAGLVPEELGVPIDVLWFGLPKPENAPPPTLGYVDRNALVLTIDRGDRYQSGMVIAKGGFERLRAQGLAAFRARVAGTAPVLEPVLGTIADWDQVKLLSVQLNRLPQWHLEGFIAIGDAAHAMSPVGGVGINYAIQDAVALAARIAPELRAGSVSRATLAAVQSRRRPPVLRMQRIQAIAHRQIARTAVEGRRRLVPRPLLRLLRLGQPVAQRATARLLGLGFRPEHVRGL
jgi:2-polyprenyl-6-methoxyphenol hydroxylase-like FAD-dependent oxidoreductase